MSKKFNWRKKVTFVQFYIFLKLYYLEPSSKPELEQSHDSGLSQENRRVSNVSSTKSEGMAFSKIIFLFSKLGETNETQDESGESADSGLPFLPVQKPIEEWDYFTHYFHYDAEL